MKIQKINKDTLVKIVLALISGFFILCGFPKISLFPMAFISIIPLMYIIETTHSYKQLFYYGFLTQILAMAGGFYWLTYTIKVHGHLPTIAAIPIFILFISFLGLRIPLFMILSKILKNKTKFSSFLIYPFTFTSIELIWPDLFPWFLANSQHNNLYFIQIADITGVYGITFVILLVNTALYHLIKLYLLKNIRKLKIVWIGAALFSFLFLYLYGALRISFVDHKIKNAKPVKVGTIQTVTPLLSIDRRRKIALTRSRLFNLSEKVLKNNEIDIFVWPESADQFIYKSPYFKKSHREKMEAFTKKYRVYFMFGEVEKVYTGINKKGKNVEVDPYNFDEVRRKGPLKNRKKVLYSTATMLNPEAEIIGMYRKVYPLPFGEYLPFGNTFPFLKKLFAEVGNFEAGNEITLFKTEYGKAAPSICYELIIPTFTRKFIKKGGDFILNQTNDGWFGKTKASYEHLALAMFRSIENRVPIVRSTNSGVSVFISAAGRYTTRLTKLYKPTTLTGEIRPVKIRTFYTEYGNIFAILVFLFTTYLFLKILFEYFRKKYFNK